MKKLFSTVLLLAVLACGPSVPSVESSSFLGNPDPFAIACTTNFSRATPHYCSNTVITGGIVMTAGACTALDLVATWGVQSTTSMIKAAFQAIIATQNAAGADRQITVAFYNAAGCAGGAQIYPSMIFSAREEVIAAAGTSLNRQWNGDVELRNGLNASVPTLWYLVTLTACATGCQVQMNLRGYFD